MTYPEGGFKAWSNVLGCFLLSLTSYGRVSRLCIGNDVSSRIDCEFLLLGQLNAFGVFQTYYAQNQLRNHSASAISWIGSTQLVLTYLSGLVLGRVFDIYGARVRNASLLFCVQVAAHTSLSGTSHSRMASINVLYNDDIALNQLLPNFPVTGCRTWNWNCSSVCTDPILMH